MIVSKAESNCKPELCKINRLQKLGNRFIGNDDTIRTLL